MKINTIYRFGAENIQEEDIKEFHRLLKKLKVKTERVVISE